MKTLSQALEKLKKPEELSHFLQENTPHPAESHQIAKTKVKKFPLKQKKTEKENLEIHRHLLPGSDQNETRFEFEAFWEEPTQRHYLGSFSPQEAQKALKNKKETHQLQTL
jgi:uncharacterized protein YchJ